MNNNAFPKLGLYSHNVASYTKTKSAYAAGEKVVGIVHATGTGKTYNALQLALDNPKKKILYIVPSVAIIEHIEEIIDSNPNLDMQRDFPNLEFCTYNSLVNMSYDELAELEIDLLILDEFHHIGAPVWGDRIKTLIATHPNMSIFGMTAYTVRDRGTIYEKDMADPDTNELFSNKIVSRYDLCDAMMDGVIPKPIYRSAYTHLRELTEDLEMKIRKLTFVTEEEQKCLNLLRDIKKRIVEAPGIEEVFRKNIRPDGKYIYFCPPWSQKGVNDIDTIMQETKAILSQFIPQENIIFYKSTSDDGELGKENRECFYNDIDLEHNVVDDKLRIIFVINQYNEGMHAPNVDGVIMGRQTSSDIVFFEQLGRALTVGNNIPLKFKEYAQLTFEELKEIAAQRDIILMGDYTKEDLMERLVAPVVIDLCNNISFIRELEDKLRDKIKGRQKSGWYKPSFIQLQNASFDIEIVNQDLYEILDYVRTRMIRKTWDDWYALAEIYFEHQGHLEIPYNFRTINGYEFSSSGVDLGGWLRKQRTDFNNGSLRLDRQKKLEQLKMRFDTKDNEAAWDERYHLVSIYYQHYGNLNIPRSFKTKNGFELDEQGIRLGLWLKSQKDVYHSGKMSEDRKKKLDQIGMNFEIKNKEKVWNAFYELACKYYQHHGHLSIPGHFVTVNGYTEDKNGVRLGRWLTSQKQFYKKKKLREDRIQKLLSIGIHFETRNNEDVWQQRYELARIYYQHYGNLEMPAKFKTKNGYEEDQDGVKLGSWLHKQRQEYQNGTLEESRKRKLEELNMRFDTKDNEQEWNKRYELAKIYYTYFGNLDIPYSFVTKNGYERSEIEDSDSVSLGAWVGNQRDDYRNGKLREDRKAKLESIGIRFQVRDIEKEWQEKFELAVAFLKHHGHIQIPNVFTTKNGYEEDKEGVQLGDWLTQQRRKFRLGKLAQDKQEKLLLLGVQFEKKVKSLDSWDDWYVLATKYYQHYGNLMIPAKFRTLDGISTNEEGFLLGNWLNIQRRKYQLGQLDKEKIEKLLLIGMVWKNKTNNQSLLELCQEYGISYEKNKILLKHISYQEMLAKIYYLEEQNIPIVVDGKLQDIFFMSSADMKDKYKISNEELILQYYVSRFSK